MNGRFIVSLEYVSLADVPRVGGKNASLGEMIRALVPRGIRVPTGFVITADAYRYFMKSAKLDIFVRDALRGLDTRDVRDLARRGKTIRTAIRAARMPADLVADIREGYRDLEARAGRNVDVAVRSSATVEDLPGASFAGEHDTFLGIRGAAAVITATQAAMASLFTDRAISYRADKGFDHLSVALSVGVQKMVRADRGASGVLFTVDTESGFRDAVIINAAWGLGELVVQGKITPDEYRVFKKTIGKEYAPIISKTLGEKSEKMIYGGGASATKLTRAVKTTLRERDAFVLSDDEILTLAAWGVAIEEHYSARAGKWTPMDIEWAKDGRTGELCIVQARPETVQARKDFSRIVEYRRTKDGLELTRGTSVGSAIVSGKARVILNPRDSAMFRAGEVLVTDMTDPDWEPIMKIARAIVTDRGGRTSHAAIVSRELGIPAIVGTGNATKKIKTGAIVTVDTTGSDGVVFRGALPFQVVEHRVTDLPKPRTSVMLNVASPERAFELSFLPVSGVGLAREEFIIASEIGIHPLALIAYPKLPPPLRREIDRRTRGYTDKTAYYIDHLSYGVGTIAAAFYPRPVIVRFSDFKTNEYRALLGGDRYEPHEENPMIGWRGAARYTDSRFSHAFALECRALKRVRDVMGLKNVIPMIPFCRTLTEADAVLAAMAKEGLVSVWVARQKKQEVANAVPVYVMCEVPSNVALVDDFLDRFDGMSIGSNDLTQLTLGLDRDAGTLRHLGDENDPAVRALIRNVVKRCRARGKYVGICGQGPSDIPDFAAFLVHEGIESMSLNPDVVLTSIRSIYEIEQAPRATRL